MEAERPSEPEQPAHEEGEPREEPLREWQPRLYLSIVTLGLLLTYGTAFVLENTKQISVHFVFATARISLIWLILLSVSLGLFAGVLVSPLYRRRRRRH